MSINPGYENGGFTLEGNLQDDGKTYDEKTDDDFRTPEDL